MVQFISKPKATKRSCKHFYYGVIVVLNGQGLITLQPTRHQSLVITDLRYNRLNSSLLVILNCKPPEETFCSCLYFINPPSKDLPLPQRPGQPFDPEARPLKFAPYFALGTVGYYSCTSHAGTKQFFENLLTP